MGLWRSLYKGGGVRACLEWSCTMESAPESKEVEGVLRGAPALCAGKLQGDESVRWLKP